MKDDRYDVVVIGAGAAGLAAASGSGPGAIAEDTRRAVEARRTGTFSAAAEREQCEQVLGDRRHGS